MKAVILALILIAMPVVVSAQEQDRGAWFKGLKQPDTGLSCCSISDCHPVPSKFEKGQWWALSRNTKRFEPIPDEKVLIDKTSILHEAVLCESEYTQVFKPFCFVPLPSGS